MKKTTRKYVLWAASLVALSLISISAYAYYLLYSPQFHPHNTVYVYIDRNDNIDSVYTKVKSVGAVKHFKGFEWMADYRDYAQCIHTGRYAINPGENAYLVFSRLYRGYQTPAKVTLNSVRSLDRVSSALSRQLMVDSAEIANLIQDSILIKQLGFEAESLPGLFIPNTYEIYWNIEADKLLQRFKEEYDRFWNESRQAKAKEIGLTPKEVSTLASIVEEETANNAEKPTVAGLYLNRLRINMPLQADPTIKFALQQTGIRRILNSDLKVESPYNTYTHTGLPPGPIRVPSTIGLDAVLNHAQHNYLYMCAKEDFSGTHNFATNYSQHLQNARRYQAALSKRNIKR